MDLTKLTNDLHAVVKLMHLPNHAYCYSAPQVIEPPSWKELPPEEKEEKIAHCLDQYGAARKAMENSVAVVTANHPDSMAFADKVCNRIYDMLKAETYIIFVEKHGREPDPDELTLAENMRLAELYGSADLRWAGNIGMSPLAIRKAFEEGNLREKMLIAFKSTHAWTGKIFNDSDKVSKLNERLKQMGCDWSIDEAMIANLKAGAKDNPYGIYNFSPITAISRIEDIRVPRTTAEIDKVAKEVALPINSEERTIPLSSREILAATNEIPEIARKRGLDKEKIKWQPGIAHLRPKTKTEIDEQGRAYTYLSGVEVLRAPQVGSISGHTDIILTLALCLSVSTKKELKQGRLALLGFMVGDKHHSVHEIMTSGKGFELPYHPRSDDYKDIYPDDPQFVELLKKEQMKQGFQMPDSYLSPKD